MSDYVDDHSDKQEEATELTFGVPVDGEIGTHGDVDFFEVDIDQDQAIGIHVVSDPEARYASIVEIIDPNGQSERVGEMAYHMRVLWRSKVAGKHHVKVQADWDSEVDSVLGAYNIEVELIDSVDEHREDLEACHPYIRWRHDTRPYQLLRRSRCVSVCEPMRNAHIA